MRRAIDKFYAFLDRPLYLSSRFLLAALVIPLILSFWAPLWRIGMIAPQYPEGLSLHIYSYKLEGGRGGRDLHEVNVLNHYIGMHSIDRAALKDLDWLPFALGALILLALRVAVVGNVRSLLDLAVIVGYVSAFGMGRFYYQLYTFGHDLDPKAPLRMPPFTPAVFGRKEIANFTTEAYPQMGSIYIGIFATGVTLILLWHLVKGRRDSLREERAAAAAAVAGQKTPA
ncbi:MAG: hypothetical protein IT371_20940 [Deltaproteobacteria bacterium]|nr:hypothetical protein [Deltaproteobacteria bacterium]